MRYCTVCTSTLLAEVNEALAAGKSNMCTARAFGFTKAIVGNHRGHMYEPPRRPKPKPPPKVKAPPKAKTFEAVDETCVRVLGYLDPGFEVEHRRILRSCLSVTRQKSLVRETLVMALFLRAQHTDWSRRAAAELKLLEQPAAW